VGGFSPKRLAQVRKLLARHVDSGFVPGMLAVLARRGEVRIEATGQLDHRLPGHRRPTTAQHLMFTPICGQTRCPFLVGGLDHRVEAP
jgi:hypothetical protein